MQIDSNSTVRIDGLLWYIETSLRGSRAVQPICSVHNLRMYPHPAANIITATKLKCADCENLFNIPRGIQDERLYVLDRVDSKKFKDMPVINLDDEALPLARSKASTDDNKYFVTTQIMKSKRGVQVVIYAGEKGNPQKAQIFVDPETKRLSFDHKDIDPSDLFLKMTAEFKDGTSQSIAAI